MSNTSYQSSPKVMFSDKGSIYFGIFLVIMMVALSTTFFAIRFQKKVTFHKKELKVSKPFSRIAIKRQSLFLTRLKSKHFLLLHTPSKLSQKKFKKIKLQDSKK